MSLFFPKQPAFYDLLLDINKSIQEIAKLFLEFSKEKAPDIEAYARRGKELERHADKKTHEVIEKLNSTFITPFDREDIYELAHELDDIVDLIESVLTNINCYHIQEKIPAVAEFAPLIVSAGEWMEKLLHILQKQKHTEQMKECKIKIHELEDQGDVVFMASISKLLKEETNAMKALKEKDILEDMEHIMDKFQFVSDIIEGIIVKSS